MTDLDLDAIEARANAATEGPWIIVPEKCGPDGQGVFTAEEFGHVCEVGDPYPRGANRPQESMEFIAAAREDVPALVAEVRRLRAREEAFRLNAAEVREFAASKLGDPALARESLALVELVESDMDAAEKAVRDA